MAGVGGEVGLRGETGLCFPLGCGERIEEEPCGYKVPCGLGSPAVTTACHLSTMLCGEEEGESEVSW